MPIDFQEYEEPKGIDFQESNAGQNVQSPVVPENDELTQEYLQERNKPLYQRAAGGIYDQLKSLGQDAYQAVVGGAQSQYQLGKKFVQNPVEAVQGLPSDLNALQRGTGSNVVGMVQGMARPAVDVFTNPENYRGAIPTDPLSFVANAGANYLKQQILPPTQNEVSRGVERLRFDKASSAQTEADIAQAKDPELIKSALAGERFAVQAAGLEEGIGALKNYAKQAAKKFAMGTDTGAPMVDLKKTPDKAGSHFVEPIDAIDTSNEKLLARVAPYQGAVKNAIKTSEAIKRGAMEVFRLDPSKEGSGTVRGTLQTISDNAPDIYQKYLDYGRNAHDVVLDTQPVSVAVEGTLGEAPSEELGRHVQTAKGAYPEKITLPGAIQKLQQVNQELGPLIRTGDTGARFQVLSAEAGALREMIDPAIEKIGGKQAAALRQTYGHMTEYAKALGKTLRKMDNNIPAHLRGSFHDLVGVGEMLSAGIHTAAHGVNPIMAAAALDGVIRLSKSADKLFWTDPDKMLGKFNQNLNKKIYIGQDIKPPEGFLPNQLYRGKPPITFEEHALNRAGQDMLSDADVRFTPRPEVTPVLNERPGMSLLQQKQALEMQNTLRNPYTPKALPSDMVGPFPESDINYTYPGVKKKIAIPDERTDIRANENALNEDSASIKSSPITPETFGKDFDYAGFRESEFDPVLEAARQGGEKELNKAEALIAKYASLHGIPLNDLVVDRVISHLDDQALKQGESVRPLKFLGSGSESVVVGSGDVVHKIPFQHGGGYGVKVKYVVGDNGGVKLSFSRDASHADLIQNERNSQQLSGVAASNLHVRGGKVISKAQQSLKMDVSTGEVDDWLRKNKAVKLNIESHTGDVADESVHSYAVKGKNGGWYMISDVTPDNFGTTKNGTVLAHDLKVSKLKPIEIRKLNLK